MSIQFYKVLHVLGALVLFMSLGAAFLRSALAKDSDAFKKEISMGHGIGLAILLIAGFGALAKLGAGFPVWVMVKMILWLVFGGILVVIKRNPALAKTLWYVQIVLGALAVYLAVYKPF